MKVVRGAICLILIAIVAISAAPPRSEAASAAKIDADVDATLHSFESQIGGARDPLEGDRICVSAGRT
jgi:hypothetical protein